MRYSGDKLRMALVAAAEYVWEQGIEDAHGPDVNVPITEIFDACGWGGWLRSENGGCPNGYTRPPDPDWCGLFVGFCGLKVGEFVEPGTCVPVSINPQVARKVLPSTYRLMSQTHWKSAGVEQPMAIHKRNVLPGDVVTVGSSKAWGTHIVLVESVLADGTYTTIEGNSRGTLPDGRRGRGVVKRKREVSEIQQVYRLDSTHFVGVD